MESGKKLILASKSPRRADLLKMIGLDFKVVPSHFEESLNYHLNDHELAEFLSFKKAKEISQKYPNNIVLGADTIVILEEKRIGKPKNINESISILKNLSGKKHIVITGVTLIKKNSNSLQSFCEITEVYVHPISDDQIEFYAKNFNTLDKAGSYGIQDWFSVCIKKINGCYYNVMGLPVSKLYRHLINFENNTL